MIIENNILKYYLRNVFFITGTAYAGKSTTVKMLAEKEVYSRIAEKTGASTATISRVNRSYVYGTGGYKAVLERIKQAEKKD